MIRKGNWMASWRSRRGFSVCAIVACLAIFAAACATTIGQKEATPAPVAAAIKTVPPSTPGAPAVAADVPRVLPTAAPLPSAKVPAAVPSAATTAEDLAEEVVAKEVVAPVKEVAAAATPRVPVVTAADQKERVEAKKLKVRPIKNQATDAAIKAGKMVGPIVTWAGAARADGFATEPIDKTPEGWPIFRNYVGSGFMMVIEGKPGFSNLEPGRSIFRHDPKDPSKRPDLEVQVDRPMGDGSATVCDARPPKFGGIPAVSPMDFSEKQQISDALNDMSCRFETFIESDASCTVNSKGDFAFVAGADVSTVQFCMVVARKWRFPEGDTTVSVRLRDREGNPGPVSKFVLRRQARPTQPPRAPATQTPTPVRRRP